MNPALDWLRACNRAWRRGHVVAVIALVAFLLPPGIGAAQGQTAASKISPVNSLVASPEDNPAASLGGPETSTKTLAARLADGRANLAAAVKPPS